MDRVDPCPSLSTLSCFTRWVGFLSPKLIRLFFSAEMLKKDLNSRKKKVAKAFQNAKRSVLDAADMTSFICCVIKASDLSNEIR